MARPAKSVKVKTGAIAGDEEDILIDQGTVEHFIECVGYSK